MELVLLKLETGFSFSCCGWFMFVNPATYYGTLQNSRHSEQSAISPELVLHRRYTRQQVGCMLVWIQNKSVRLHSPIGLLDVTSTVGSCSCERTGYVRHQHRHQPPGRSFTGGRRLTFRDRRRVAAINKTRLRASESRDGTGPHFVTQRPSDPGIQQPGDPVDPVTLFYNELQMSKK